MRARALAALVALALIAGPPLCAEAGTKARAKAKPKAVVSVRKPAEIPKQAIDAIAAGDLSTAVLALREEPSSPKVNYLIRQATTIVLDQIGEKPSRSEAHKYHQNVAVAYHNLYLFLKSRGIDNTEYFEQALRHYRKARHAGTVLHKAECDLLSAAIHASAGDRSRAQSIFEKIDQFMLRSDFESAEYLAAYHAAMAEVAEASSALRTAYDISPSGTVAWLEVGDDFHEIEGDPAFKALVTSLGQDGNEMDLTVRTPADSTPKLDVASPRPMPLPKKKAASTRKSRAR